MRSRILLRKMQYFQKKPRAKKVVFCLVIFFVFISLIGMLCFIRFWFAYFHFSSDFYYDQTRGNHQVSEYYEDAIMKDPQYKLAPGYEDFKLPPVVHTWETSANDLIKIWLSCKLNDFEDLPAITNGDSITCDYWSTNDRNDLFLYSVEVFDSVDGAEKIILRYYDDEIINGSDYSKELIGHYMGIGKPLSFLTLDYQQWCKQQFNNSLNDLEYVECDWLDDKSFDFSIDRFGYHNIRAVFRIREKHTELPFKEYTIAHHFEFESISKKEYDDAQERKWSFLVIVLLAFVALCLTIFNGFKSFYQYCRDLTKSLFEK